ncbi:hypothetical protein E3T39_07360 [Cryobacterium suzukii]|uniref:ImmA/IrrE family metallo-endopeptidase n=1 Tax=Cryobacterium suzukii TaxID=1259198 RepID=A0A4R9AFD4_9MICO|nr:hypothetical protein [Cryobacterium suzukii]TFD60921.1 hypothetical protein E3T39_07360 [Cryobacterium suzukii]
MTVVLTLKGTPVTLERKVFVALFKNSVVSERAGVNHALKGRPLPFNEFLQLARQAEIPYPLFFAPLSVVEAQIKLKTKKLMSGFTKASFSMHSRHRVELCDVELIVKDLLRKQELLRVNDASLVKNPIVGLLRNSRGTVQDDANRLMDAISLTGADIRAAKNKEAALELLIVRLEAKQIFVSRSAKDHMPQGMPRHAKFSGMTIKDKKVPFIFLATGDEGEHLEPAGRKLFTLVLLTVLIARETFAPVNYNGHTKDETSPLEYQLTAELLMPAGIVQAMRFPDLQAVKDAADEFKVTPSAIAMRARRLGCITREVFENYMDALKAEYGLRTKSQARSPRAVNALKKYNGLECSRRMLAMLDAGQLNRTEFRRIALLNKISSSQIDEFRAAVG